MLNKITLLSLLWALSLAVPAGAQDPLGSLIQEGLTNNLSLKGQRLAGRQSELEVDRARGLFLPNATVNGRFSHLNGVLDLGDLVNPAYQALNQLTGSNSFPTDLHITLPYAQDLRFRVTQPLFDASILANYSISRSLREVERGRVGVTARELAAAIQLKYLQYAGARQVVELYRSTIDVLQENLRSSQRLVEAGSTTPDAVSRARADLSETVQRLAEAGQRRDAAAQSFNQTMGRPLDQPIEAIQDSELTFPMAVTLEEALQRARDGARRAAPGRLRDSSRPGTDQTRRGVFPARHRVGGGLRLPGRAPPLQQQPGLHRPLPGGAVEPVQRRTGRGPAERGAARD